jgi:hypothetical protein
VPNKVTISGQIVSTNGITLFFANGTSQVMSANDWKTGAILEKIMPALAKGGHAEIDLDDFVMAKELAKIGIEVKEDGDKIAITTKNVEVKDAGALRGFLDHAIANEDADGFKAFMKKFSEIKRQHTAEDILRFMKGSGLFIAKDGSILAYKRLVKTSEKNVFADPRTSKVRQRLGSLVYMPESKVDDDRRHACGTGLHIGSQQYFGGYWCGNSVMALTKIQPKDFIAVPNHDAKVRVSAYHIIKVLPDALGAKVAHSQRIIDDKEGLKLLNEAIDGDHIGIIERVKVGAWGEHSVEKVANVRERKKVTVKKRTFKHNLKTSVKAVKATLARLRGKDAKDKAYAKKLDRARKLQAQVGKDGKPKYSLRQIAKKVGMDRESMMKNLKS